MLWFSAYSGKSTCRIREGRCVCRCVRGWYCSEPGGDGCQAAAHTGTQAHRQTHLHVEVGVLVLEVLVREADRLERGVHVVHPDGLDARRAPLPQHAADEAGRRLHVGVGADEAVPAAAAALGPGRSRLAAAAAALHDHARRLLSDASALLISAAAAATSTRERAAASAAAAAAASAAAASRELIRAAAAAALADDVLQRQVHAARGAVGESARSAK